MTNVDARNAAEVLLGRGGAQNEAPTTINSQYYDNPHESVTHSVSSQDRVLDEAVMFGTRSQGRMSVIRRFFCLFSLFDLLFTSLTWFISVMIVGHDDVIKALRDEVLHYNIKYSTFDIVMASACRFTVILLYYGILYLNTRVFVALTTAGTCAFIICKVIYYDWGTANQPVFQVIIILATFVVCWSEVWFLDCRVLPQELHASQYLAQSSSRLVDPYTGYVFDPNIPNPILRSFLRNTRSEDMGDSVRNFYSPMESEGSDDDDAVVYVPHPSKALSLEDTRLVAQSKEILEKAWETLTSPGWQQMHRADEVFIFTKTIPIYGSIFLMKTVYHIAAETLIHDLFQNINDACLWNPSLTTCQRIRAVTSATDITYQVSKASVGGTVKARDFINLRRYGKKGNTFIAAAASITHVDYPPTRNPIRADNGASCFAATSTGDNSCEFNFMVVTDLKGWLKSKSILKAPFITMFLNVSKALRLHIDKILAAQDTDEGASAT